MSESRLKISLLSSSIRRLKIFVWSSASLGKYTAKSQQAIDLLTHAVARDPSFFDAYYLLSGFIRIFIGMATTILRRALPWPRPRFGRHLAFVRMQVKHTRAAGVALYHGDYAGALAELEIAEPKLPNDPRVFSVKASIQRRQGHWEESIQNHKRALELDPRSVHTLNQLALTYSSLRRYADQKSMVDRALAIEPNDFGFQVDRAAVELSWKADTRPLHQLLDSIRATDRSAFPDIDRQLLGLALAEHDAATAREALSRLGEETFAFETVHFTPRFMEGLIARMTNDDRQGAIGFCRCARGAGENRHRLSQITARLCACLD